MAGYYNKNKDYSVAIKQAQDRGASKSEINRLRQERQNKINAVYGGRDPYRGRDNIMGHSHRNQANATISRPGGRLYYDNGTPAVHNAGRPWQPGVDYAAQAQHYANQGDWDAVDDVLMRRQAKIDDQGGYDRGLSNRQLWDNLRRSHGYEVSSGGYGGGRWEPGSHRRPGGHGGGGGSYLEGLYRQKMDAQLAALRAKWEQDAAGIRAQNASMASFYDELRNRQAAQNDLERLRLGEMGQAQGLNTGTFGQLALGQSGAYQDAFAKIGQQEAAAQEESGWKLQQLESAYRQAAYQAQAQGEAELMDVLYQEYVRQIEAQARERREAAAQQEREERYQQELAQQQHRDALERAKTLARHGDFSGYAALGYSKQEIAAMQAQWQRQQAKKRR